MMEKRTIDVSTALGILTAMALVMAAIAFKGTPLAFLDAASMLIVVGATFAITTACFTIPEIWRAQGLMWRTVFYTHHSPKEAAEVMIEYAQTARKSTVLALQNQLAASKSPDFLDKGLGMVVDGVPHAHIEALLTQDIQSLIERHSKGVSVLRKAAEVAPAMGLIGTLIGLVQMLGSLDDPSKIGPAMAVALLTTMYGAMLSYMVFSPLASKLERNTDEEILMNKIYMSSILSIARQENPRQLENMLNSILPPSSRVTYFV